MFTSEGYFNVEIIAAYPAAPRFQNAPQGSFDVCIEVRDVESGASDFWCGEISANYGKGNFSDRTQAQITMETLHKIGFQGNDLSQLPTLIGVKTTAKVESSVSNSNGKTYYNVRYLGGGSNAPEEITAEVMQQRLVAMFGTPAQQAPVQQQAPAQQPAQAPVQQQQAPAPVQQAQAQQQQQQSPAAAFAPTNTAPASTPFSR